MSKEWRLVEADIKTARRISKSFDLPLSVAKLLVARGLTKKKKISAFLAPDLDDLHKPTRLTGTAPASELIFESIKLKEKICVFGDFDVDGLTSTALLTTVLKELGADVVPFIPDRFDHGYGLNSDVIRELAADGIRLLITVDCGISGIDEIALAKDIGIKVIVVDHHRPSSQLPAADVIINPHQPDCDYPFKELAGVGLAFKLAQVLTSKTDKPEAVLEHLDLVALGTVADMAPLVDENRIIVHHGLRALRETRRVGLRKLMEVCGMKNGPVTAGQVGFGLAPRLNASGRLSSANDSLKLLLTLDVIEALELARQLDAQNRERQKVEKQMLSQAIEMVETQGYRNTLVFASEDWHEGVKGIVASRLVERYFRPTILFTKKDGLYVGSARSIPKFNIHKALEACSELLVRWGGHSAAAGLSVREQDFDKFRAAFEKVAADTLCDTDFIDYLAIDIEAIPTELTTRLAKEIEQLEPFGVGNPKPSLALSYAFTDGLKRIGANKEHLKCFLHTDGFAGEAIAFKIGPDSLLLKDGQPLDLAFHLNVNTYGGREDLQIKVIDVRVSQAEPVGSDKKTTIQVPTPGSGFLLPDSSSGTVDPARVGFIDKRGTEDKDTYLNQLLNQGLPITIYVRDEHEGVLLAKRLTKINGRLRAEVTVTCQAPDETDKHQRLVIYQAPLTAGAMIDLCATRMNGDGKKLVYLLYDKDDLALARRTMESLCPDRQRLAEIYRLLRDLGPFDLDEAAGVCRQKLKSDIYEPATRHLALLVVKILVELGLVVKNDDGKLMVAASEAKVELDNSRTWKKASRMKNEFFQFEGRAMTMVP